MSAMQDFYIAPVSIDAVVARAQAERSMALAAIIRQLPVKIGRLIAFLRQRPTVALGHGA